VTSVLAPLPEERSAPRRAARSRSPNGISTPARDGFLDRLDEQHFTQVDSASAILVG
jgi:hypothetical protein